MCGKCHGPDGTDPDAPRLLERGWLKGFVDAAGAFKYVRESVPNDNPGTRAEQEYWDVLAYLLNHHGLKVDPR